MDIEFYLKKYAGLLAAQDFDEKFLDYSGVERHIGFLRQLASVENSSIVVLDVYKGRYVFVQSKFLSLLGTDADEAMQKGPRYFFSIMHPEDLPFAIETGILSAEFLLQQPPAERKNFKTIYDFRLKDNNGNYVRFLQQVLPLELDGKGNLWLMLMVNDLIPDKRASSDRRRSIVHLGTGKQYTFGPDEDRDNRSILTKREVEILGLLAKGMASKTVADELFLSVNTVNNHRKNILEKTNAGNTAEAIRYAISLGLI